MKASIQTKLLILCIVLALITTNILSFSYYSLSKREAERQSRERIQIAFEIMFDDFVQQEQFYARQFREFMAQESSLEWALFSYKNKPSELSSTLFIVSYLAPFAQKMRDFSGVVGARQLALYAWNGRLLTLYRQQEVDEAADTVGTDIVGTYVMTKDGAPSFLPITQEFSLLGASEIPEAPLPPDTAPAYDGDLPTAPVIAPFRQDGELGMRVEMPVYRDDELIGALASDILYTQSMFERYAALSNTDINLFVGDQISLGTLPAQDAARLSKAGERPLCADLRDAPAQVAITTLAVGESDYYHSSCDLSSTEGERLGTLSVNLSQAREHAHVQAMRWTVLLVSLAVLVAAVLLSFLASRPAIHTINNLVRVMGAAAGGDLRPSAIAAAQDEFGMLARSLNQMITQLRAISQQVQQSSAGVNRAADTVFQEMNGLMNDVQEQTAGVEHTISAVETIKTFIETVARNTAELLTTSAHILSSIQETRASVRDVSASTGALTTNLHLISAAIDQVKQSAAQMSGDTGALEEIARQTASEIRQIEDALAAVSQYAEANQDSAQKTMDAVTVGQQSVEASVQGMLELKEVAVNTAGIIQEVNAWGAEVSSILDIVDEITGQTELLSLNASIISAQAGEHGRGFAVVASEIKELADRTRNSTKEIATLVHALQKKTAEGVSNTEDGIRRAEDGVQRANAAKEALTTILEQASQASRRAADTADMIQQTAGSSQAIGGSMTQVTDMVSHIRRAIEEENVEIDQVVSAVENISGMAEQVNRASLEQQQSADQIAAGMEGATERFSDISDQTATLRDEANQILDAMRTIERISAAIRQNAAAISGDTVEGLVKHSAALQDVVRVFKVS